MGLISTDYMFLSDRGAVDQYRLCGPYGDDPFERGTFFKIMRGEVSRAKLQLQGNC